MEQVHAPLYCTSLILYFASENTPLKKSFSLHTTTWKMLFKWETVQLTLSSVGTVTDLLQVLTEWCTGRMLSSERRICNFLLNEALIFSVVGSLSQLSPRNETCIFCLVQTKAITLKSKSRNRNPGLFFFLSMDCGSSINYKKHLRWPHFKISMKKELQATEAGRRLAGLRMKDL